MHVVVGKLFVFIVLFSYISLYRVSINFKDLDTFIIIIIIVVN